ncbi:MAG: phosphotransacetylase family protein [Candidatus Altiarchaeota archaeon]
MKSLFIGSSESRSGKSALCVGLGSILKDKGLNVGYMKPVGSLARTVNKTTYEDDAFKTREALGLSESPDKICPVLISEELVDAKLKGVKKYHKNKIIKTFQDLSAGKDVMILEGMGDIGGGSMFDLSDPEVAALLDAKIILTAKYDSDYVLDRVISDVKLIGDPKQLVGVIFTDVSPANARRIKRTVTPFLRKKKIKVLGYIPKDTLLKSASVADIAEELGGRIICCEEYKNELVKSFIIGAMSPEHALKYFRRSTDKAVITGGDRADIVLAALETQTKCVVLTGNLRPSAQVLAAAEDAKTPLIVVPHDTVTAVTLVEDLIDKITAWEGAKLARMKQFMRNHIDLKAIYRELSVK